jgi:hypothetical protein
MTIILGFGTEQDPEALPLYTRRRRSFIRNVQRKQLPREVIQARTEPNLQIDHRIQLLSCATTYNCFGLVFASRRTCISEEDIPRVLQDDGYRTLPWDAATWRPGDLLLYSDGSEQISHVGEIVRIEHDLLGGDPAVWIISAWGETGEYLHPPEAVSYRLGRPFRVVSQRLSYDS